MNKLEKTALIISLFEIIAFGVINIKIQKQLKNKLKNMGVWDIEKNKIDENKMIKYLSDIKKSH